MATPAFAADLYAPYIPPSNDPVYAPAPMITGDLSLGIGFLNSDGSFFESDDTIGVFTGGGRANINLGGAWNVMLETGGTALFDNGYSYSTVGVGGHLWTRLNGGAVGVYGAVDFPTGATIGTVGVEGKAYLGNVTLGADASYSWSDNAGDLWRIRGDADYYFTPDFKIGAELAYVDYQFGDSWSAGVNSEYRFTGTPFGAWGAVNYTNFSSGGPDVWTGLVGINLYMDAPASTLKQHDEEVPWHGMLSSSYSLAF